MGDMLYEAAAWLDGMRRGHLSRFVSYTRASQTQPCLATVSRSSFETQSDNGVVERWESRDYIISYHELPFPVPQRGDRITETAGDSTVSYEVCAPAGSPVWQWADAYGNAVRVHTKMISQA